MSGITIPMADLAGGRAPSPRVVEGTGGQAVAEFGERLGRIGDAMESERLDREMMRTRVDMQRELGQAALELQSVGDPDALDAGWIERSQATRSRIVEGADPRIRARVGIAFDELSDRHALSIGARALDARQSQVRATLADLEHGYVATAAGGDAGVTQASHDQLADSYAEAAANGVVTWEAANAAMRRAKADGATASAIAALDGDPGAFVAALDAGEYQDLDPVARERFKVSARDEVARRDAASQAEAERQAKERATVIGDELGEIIAISGQGIRAAQTGLLDDPEAQAHPLYAQARAAAELVSEQPRIGMATVGELDAMIAEEKKRPVVRKYQTERLQVLEAQRESTAEDLGTDPVAWAGRSGISVPALELGGAPGALAESLRKRAAWGAAMASQGYGDAVAALPLSLAEQAEIKKRTGVDQDPAARAALAGELAVGLGARGAATLSGDPVFGHVAGLVAAGGPPALAEEVFRGEQAIEQKTVTLPPAKDRLDAAFDATADLFAGLPGGEALQAQVMAAADALYAARMRSTDPAGDMDAGAWSQALHEVLGGTGSGRTRTGGIQEVRDRMTALPAGYRAIDVETALDRLGTRAATDVRGQRQVAVRGFDQDLLGGQLAAISADGRVPSVAGEPLRPEDLPQLTLRAVGGDEYVLVFRNAAGEQVLAGEDGRDWHLSLRKLMRRVSP